MPTTHTHDLYGKLIYRQMPDEMKRIIRTHGELYRIGLHGPDILFYYMVSKNPVSQFGVKMHKGEAAAFFERGMKRAKETKDEELYAYLIGFGCHYLLDSALHPHVNLLHRKKIVTHTAVEKELDRMLMIETGRNPYVFRPSDAVKVTYHYAEVIHRAIPEIKTGNIYLSLHMMKFLTNRMVCNDKGRKRKIIETILTRLPIKEGKDLSQHFMSKDPEQGSEQAVRMLRRRFQYAISGDLPFLLELDALYRSDGALGERWNFTYNG